MPPTTDRALGALLGVAAGDSLGATLEFTSPNTGEPLRDIVGGGPFGWGPGQPTDDTDLTVAVVRAHLDPRPDLLSAVAHHFVAWYQRGPRDIGGTTAGAMNRLVRGVPPTESGATADHSAANGSLMRCVATGVARADTTVRRHESAAISAVTHAEPRCVDSCTVYNDVVSALLDGATPTEAVTAALDNTTLRPQTREVAAGALEDPARPIPWKPGGYVLTALDIALWAVLRDDPAEDLLVQVVNMGGDADTNGAIAGGLLGARDGAAALPARWRDRLEAADELAAATEPLLALRGVA